MRALISLAATAAMGSDEVDSNTRANLTMGFFSTIEDFRDGDGDAEDEDEEEREDGDDHEELRERI